MQWSIVLLTITAFNNVNCGCVHVCALFAESGNKSLRFIAVSLLSSIKQRWTQFLWWESLKHIFITVLFLIGSMTFPWQRRICAQCINKYMHKCWKIISYNIVFQLLEENIITFVKNELKRFQRILQSSTCPEKDSEDEDVLASKAEEQTWSTREAFVKITLDFLRGMNQEELAVCLQSSKGTPTDAK